MRDATGKVAVVMTCHNRREKTLACLESVYRQELKTGHDLKVVVVDDGSTDGTASAVHQAFPDTIVLEGDGSLFWNGGMRVAMQRARALDPDHYLWLNDDTTLYADAVDRLLSTWSSVRERRGRPLAVVGSVRDPVTGELTYGGWRRSNWYNPLKVEIVEPGDEPLPCDTFNGNLVLIDAEMVGELGNLDPAFTHGFGDFDYGFRARDAGLEVWVAPGVLGECPRDRGARSWFDPDLPLRERMAALVNTKVEPVDERRVYARRHGGIFWPIPWLAPYLRVILDSLFPGMLRPSRGPGAREGDSGDTSFENAG